MSDLNYYKMESYRRKMLDLLQEKYKHLYKGIVLDIGGRDKGKFKKPKNNVDKWIYIDIIKEYNPDMILDVAEMSVIESNSIDVLNGIELFEHVKEIEKGLKECYRVLKSGGYLIISMPFLYPIHSDPYDFQRWTILKWRLELSKIGFKIEKAIIMGKYFFHLSEVLKEFINAIARNKVRGAGLLYRISLPVLDKIIRFDKKSFVIKDPVLNNYHNGYFIIAKK